MSVHDKDLQLTLETFFKSSTFTLKEFSYQYQWHFAQSESMASDSYIRAFLRKHPRIEIQKIGRENKYKTGGYISPKEIFNAFVSYCDFNTALGDSLHETRIYSDAMRYSIQNTFLMDEKDTYERLAFYGVYSAMRSSSYGLYFCLYDIKNRLGITD